MHRWTCLCEIVIDPLRRQLEDVPLEQRAAVREIRLRTGVPMIVMTAHRTYRIGQPLTAAHIHDCFFRICGYAVHTHQNELGQGFVTAKGGIRVGIAGTAVIREGSVTSYRDVTSLCIRVPHMLTDVALPLLPFAQHNGGAVGMLLCGAPSSGKTTVLADLARLLSDRCQVAVVDERCELSGFDLVNCDVLRGCPKTQGILQAVRVLSPDVIAVDELGDAAEWAAVRQSLFCGVPVIASAHITSRNDVKSRAELMDILSLGGFAILCLLSVEGSGKRYAEIWKAREYVENSGNPLGRVCLCDGGYTGDISSEIV